MIKKYSYFAFFAFGFFVMILPSALPLAMKEFGIDYSQSGYVMMLGTAGYIGGSLICALFAHKIGLKRIASLGSLISAAGLFYFFFVHDFLNLSIANFATNIGMGFIETGIGALIGSSEENVSSTLNKVNALFALGSFVSPFVVAFFIKYGFNWQISYLIGSVIAFISFVVSLKIENVKERPVVSAKKFNAFSGLFIMIYAMIGIYVGYEATYSSWITTFLTNFRHINVATAALSSAIFWMGMFVGRLLASYIKVRNEIWLIFIVAFSLSGVIFSIAIPQFYISMFFVFFSGLFFASTYPTIQLMLIERAGSGIGNLMGIFVFFVGIGATLAQWVVSSFSNAFGILAGFSIIPVMITVELILSISMERKNSHNRMENRSI
ncbi:MAG: hypothetical protein C0176_06445 [Mesoaciditoga sp.]|uniref:MFS transporter n=1 Tax=Athalassotoga sp. TaxID=2022597 RepID=UPI000CBB55F7|nr:MAG: hypothetical protein C0185_02300 [Mesoaciditoga sp.]PMP79125.1 MAG: hypothetical protein C0176_06445 [Mesoaciditoga sp.]HEU24581.1 MFS transporter [Mesoaciditoga lauensis]